MPRIIETTASGNPIPDYLTQSRRQILIQTGVMGEAHDGTLFLYSGMISPTIGAQASLEMARFTLLREARFDMTFALDTWVAGTSAYGVEIVLGPNSDQVFRQISDQSAGFAGAKSPWNTLFYVPANCEAVINFLNPETSANLFQANVTLNGRYL